MTHYRKLIITSAFAALSQMVAPVLSNGTILAPMAFAAGSHGGNSGHSGNASAGHDGAGHDPAGHDAAGHDAAGHDAAGHETEAAGGGTAEQHDAGDAASAAAVELHHAKS